MSDAALDEGDEEAEDAVLEEPKPGVECWLGGSCAPALRGDRMRGEEAVLPGPTPRLGKRRRVVGVEE